MDSHQILAQHFGKETVGQKDSSVEIFRYLGCSSKKIHAMTKKSNAMTKKAHLLGPVREYYPIALSLLFILMIL